MYNKMIHLYSLIYKQHSNSRKHRLMIISKIRLTKEAVSNVQVSYTCKQTINTCDVTGILSLY